MVKALDILMLEYWGEQTEAAKESVMGYTL